VREPEELDASWEGTRRLHRRAAARLTPLERLRWLEATKDWVARSWRARAAADPSFRPRGDWWREPREVPRRTH
jgi:hypothetical protein